MSCHIITPLHDNTYIHIPHMLLYVYIRSNIKLKLNKVSFLYELDEKRHTRVVYRLYNNINSKCYYHYDCFYLVGYVYEAYL